MEHWAGKGDVQRMGCTSEALRTAEALALNESGRTLCEFVFPILSVAHRWWVSVRVGPNR